MKPTKEVLKGDKNHPTADSAQEMSTLPSILGVGTITGSIDGSTPPLCQPCTGSSSTLDIARCQAAP